jgi:hypothetical protein
MLKRKKIITNQSGMATLEIVSIFAVIMILFNFGLGFFGVIHTGILKNIAARNYALETYRFRSNLDFFWREGQGTDKISNFRHFGNRFHGVTSENTTNSENWVATARQISFVSSFGGTDADGNDFSRTPAVDSNSALHNTQIFKIKDDGNPLLDEKDQYQAYPVWIRPVYGICINSTCTPVN